MTPRIAIIGGGSAHWTPRLLLDFVNTPSLAESQVVLMDTAAGVPAAGTTVGRSHRLARVRWSETTTTTTSSRPRSTGPNM